MSTVRLEGTQSTTLPSDTDCKLGRGGSSVLKIHEEDSWNSLEAVTFIGMVYGGERIQA